MQEKTGITLALCLCPMYLPLSAANIIIKLRLSGFGDTKHNIVKFYNAKQNPVLNCTSEIDRVCGKRTKYELRLESLSGQLDS